MLHEPLGGHVQVVIAMIDCLKIRSAPKKRFEVGVEVKCPTCIQLILRQYYTPDINCIEHSKVRLMSILMSAWTSVKIEPKIAENTPKSSEMHAPANKLALA